MSIALAAMLALTPAEIALFGDAYLEPTYSVEQVTGTFALPQGWGSAAGCDGSYTIRPDGTAEIRSGAAVVTMALTFELDEEEINWMHRRVTASNGKADCNGIVRKAGATDKWAFDALPDRGMRLCIVDKERPRVFAMPCPHILSRLADS